MLEDSEGLDDRTRQWLDFIRRLIHYALRAGNVIDIDELAEPQFVARVTGLPLEQVQQLQAQIAAR